MTEDELLAEIAEAIQGIEATDEPGTITTGEVSAALGYNVKKTLAALKALANTGKIEPAKVRRVNLWGTVMRVNGWRIAEVAHDP
jgi:hypothetical protein